MKTAEEILKEVVHKYQQEHGEDSGFTIDFHVKPKDGSPGATVYILTDLMGQAMEEYAAQFQAPALPEATVQGLEGKFFAALTPFAEQAEGDCSIVWDKDYDKIFAAFLPAIQEVIAAEKGRQSIDTIALCAKAGGKELAAKEAEIKRLSDLLDSELKAKLFGQLSQEAQAYYNEVAYSLDYGDGQVATDAQILNHCLEELAAFEEWADTSVTDYLQEQKAKEGIKRVMATVTLHDAEEISSTPEKAREYLKSQGIDPDAIAEKGLAVIKLMTDIKALHQTCDEYKEEIQVLKKKINTLCDSYGIEEIDVDIAMEHAKQAGWLPFMSYDLVQCGYPHPDHGEMVARPFKGTDENNSIGYGGGEWCRVSDAALQFKKIDDKGLLRYFETSNELDSKYKECGRLKDKLETVENLYKETCAEFGQLRNELDMLKNGDRTFSDMRETMERQTNLIEKIKSERDVLIGDNNRLTQQVEQLNKQVDHEKNLRKDREKSNEEKEKYIKTLHADYDNIWKQLEERKGMQWVKAKERNPEKSGYYNICINGGYMGAYFRNRKTWEDISGYRITGMKENGQWLDESAPLPDSKQEAFDFEKWRREYVGIVGDEGIWFTYNGSPISKDDLWNTFQQHQQSQSKEGI